MDRLAKPNFPQDVSHLIGRRVPGMELQTSEDTSINFSNLSGVTVVFVQPGSSSAITPIEGWVDGIKQIPGAAGCTGQCKAFQSLSGEFSSLGARVVGLSGQTPGELAAVKEKLGITYDLVSDLGERWLHALGMRPVSYASPDGSGNRSYHPRMTLILKDGEIVDARVPELTPEGASGNAEKVLEFLRALK